MQSNDATFEREGPTTAESGQQLAMARIRAVEFDRAVVVASTTGYSAIVAPDGQLVSRSGIWTQAELEARVPLLSYTTLAERLGAWPEWAIVAATSLALGLAIGQAGAARRRRTRSGNVTTRTRRPNKLGHPKLPRENKEDGHTVHGRRLTLTALASAAGLLVAACQSGAPVATQLNPTAVAGKPAAAVARYLKISPAPGVKDVNPGNGITVTAVNGGKITDVTVKSVGRRSGHRRAQRGQTSWHSTYALPTGSSYLVTATGTDSGGHPVTATSSFSTPTPSNTFPAEIFEGAGATYGVGMPIMLTFSQPITNKAAVERSLQLTTSKPVVGAWYWDGSEQLDFRPRDYWPADTTVGFDGHLNGVEGAQRRVRGPRPHPDVHHRPVGHRGRLHRHPPDPDLRRRQARLHLADLHRQEQPADPGRHLPDRPEGQPGADDRRQQGHRRLLQRAGQLGGPVHLQRRLLPLGPVVGRQPGHHQRQPRLREPAP